MISESRQPTNVHTDHQYLRDFFERAPIGFHVFGPNRKFIDINQAELDIIGYKREEIVDIKEWSDLIIDEQRPQFEKHWEAINAEGEVTNFHYTLLHKKGRRVEVLLNASARFDIDGKLINTRGIVFDITQEFETRMFVSSKSGLSLIEQKKLLEQKNLALNQLLLRVEMEKNRLMENVNNSVRELTLPLLKRLRRKGTALDQRYIDILENGLRAVTSNFATHLAGGELELSAREKEICQMIKEGYSSRQIADLLNSSVRTVDNHRNHIRKKLGISGRRMDLVKHLQSLAA